MEWRSRCGTIFVAHVRLRFRISEVADIHHALLARKARDLLMGFGDVWWSLAKCFLIKMGVPPNHPKFDLRRSHCSKFIFRWMHWLLSQLQRSFILRSSESLRFASFEIEQEARRCQKQDHSKSISGRVATLTNVVNQGKP